MNDFKQWIEKKKQSSGGSSNDTTSENSRLHVAQSLCLSAAPIMTIFEENAIMETKKSKKPKKNSSKRSRLIIRNVSFQAKEDDLKKLFEAHGTVVDVNIPRKIADDGRPKSKGFAFLSFDTVKSSLLAIKHLNGKEFMGRRIAVDFAVAKSFYEQMEQKPKVESKSSDDEKEENEDDDDQDEEDDYQIDEDEDDEMQDGKKKKPRKPKSDIKEGKTLFIRNVDLETDESSLVELFGSYGELEYCKICYDSYTGQPKGSAFVKFKRTEDAQKCREEAAEQDNQKFYLDGQQLLVTEALTRGDVEQLREAKQRRHKDKRNLYLAKEGLIYPDSPAARGVSPADLKKRLTLEEKKHRLLRNLHYFISDTRLCVHNLPASMDDAKLRKLFLSAAGNDPDVQIVWAKVMRNREKSGPKEKFGRSKGYGFVEFGEHRHALNALRHLNNNPNVFTEDRRPIVEFSVENKVALNRKKYRLMKQQKMQHQEKDVSDQKENNGLRRRKRRTSSVKIDGLDQEQESGYSGIEARPFENGEKVRRTKSNRKLTEQKRKLKERNRKLKSAAKTHVQRAAASGADNDPRIIISKKKKKAAAKNKLVEADDFETNYLQKKRAKRSLDTADGQKSATKTDIVRKRKWYQST